MKISLFLILQLFILTKCSAQKNDYIIRYTVLSNKLSDRYKIPSSIILGVGILESNFGKSIIAKRLNNHFGIVGKNGGRLKSRYKYFTSPEDSYIAFCEIISNKKFYSKLKGTNNFKTWAGAISKTGYSEAPAQWESRLINIIIKYKLNELQ